MLVGCLRLGAEDGRCVCVVLVACGRGRGREMRLVILQWLIDRVAYLSPPLRRPTSTPTVIRGCCRSTRRRRRAPRASTRPRPAPASAPARYVAFLYRVWSVLVFGLGCIGCACMYECVCFQIAVRVYSRFSPHRTLISLQTCRTSRRRNKQQGRSRRQACPFFGPCFVVLLYRAR